MKKKGIRTLAVGAALALVCTCSLGAMAAEVLVPDSGTPTVTLTATGSSAAFSFNRDDKNLFDSFSGVMPGDTLDQKVTLAAASANPHSYNVYLYAKLNAEGKTEAELQAAQDFLDELGLTVTKGSDTLDLISTPGTGEQGVALGTLAPGQTLDLTVALTVDINVGNEIQAARAELDWVFYAQEIIPSSGGGGDDRPSRPSTPPTGPSEPPTVIIPGGDVPLGPGETPAPGGGSVDGDGEEEIIGGGDVPLGPAPDIDANEEGTPVGDMPQTGDESHLLLWGLLALASGGGLVLLIVTGKRRGEE